MAKKKITRTWKIDPDIAKLVDQCSEKTHLPKGDLVQLGAYIAINLSHSVPLYLTSNRLDIIRIFERLPGDLLA